MNNKENNHKASYPEGDVPKAVRVENAANILVIEFDNGEKRYLKSHYINDYLDAYSLKRGRGKRRLLFWGGPANIWLGSEFEIQEDGTVILFGKDKYSPQELWYESQPSVTLL